MYCNLERVLVVKPAHLIFSSITTNRLSEMDLSAFDFRPAGGYVREYIFLFPIILDGFFFSP